MTGRTGTRGPSHDGCARPAQGGPGTVSGTAAPVRSHRLSVAPVLVPPAQDRGMDMAAEWPVQDFLELGALPGAVPSARLHTRQILWEWALAALSENAEQVVSELTTNAVAAARAMPQIPPVRLWLLTDRIQVLSMGCQPAATDFNPGRRLCRERPGTVPGRDVQRPVGVISHAAVGRQGCLGAMRQGVPGCLIVLRGPASRSCTPGRAHAWCL
jgi:hypothetical protein